MSDSSGVELALAVAAAAALVALALARRRAPRRRVPLQGLDEELDGEPADDDGRRRRAEQQALDLEEGALDPDELEGEPAVWDEGADDETR